MALFCNNQLCEFTDCERRYDGTKQVVDGDYIGDFAPTCRRLSDSIIASMNSGTWKCVLQRKFDKDEQQCQFDVESLDQSVRKAIADPHDHDQPKPCTLSEK